MQRIFLPFFIFSLLFVSIFICAKKTLQNRPDTKQTEWLISDLLAKKTAEVKILGNPSIVACKYGKAVTFNGKNEGIFVNKMPLAGLSQFTVEIIMKPDSGGNFEQRYFHCGEIKESRVLIELRSTPKGWYFDAFLKAGEQQKTLIDSTLVHPSNQWYHVAFVIDHGQLTTYINGKKELEGKIPMTPLLTGKTSIGVRQNELSWFKGEIYKIRITPQALLPKQFTKF
jgi:hypothetical protein